MDYPNIVIWIFYIQPYTVMLDLQRQKNLPKQVFDEKIENLASQPAAVYGNGITVDVVRCRRSQEHNRPHQVAW